CIPHTLKDINTFCVCLVAVHFSVIFFVRLLRAKSSTLFPYTTLFRSRLGRLRTGSNQRSNSPDGFLWPNWLNISQPPTSAWRPRSEEHTSELQSRGHLVCRLLLEKKKQHKMVM